MSGVWKEVKEVKEARGRERTRREMGTLRKGQRGRSEERKGRKGETASEERREYWDSKRLRQGVLTRGEGGIVMGSG